MFGKSDTPVCGSDGVTYPSQCQVISRQCEGESILIKHKGPCPGNSIIYFVINYIIIKNNYLLNITKIKSSFSSI